MPTLDNLQVTLLIGQDNINLISPVRLEQGPSSAPSASLFKLGWTISGPHTVLDDSKTQYSMHHTALFCSNCLEQINDLNEEVSLWWKTETMPLESKSKSNDPEVLLANKILNKTCVRQADRRYETGLLWKDSISLPDNRSQALIHLNHLVNRLQKKPEQYKKYNEGIHADLKKDYIAKVLFHQQKDTGWYIPHYGLVNPNKPDKIRKICNAKAPQSGTSLNDKLLAGNDLLGNMLGVLLRFRQGAVTIQGDIEAMFMQIGVQQKDRRYLRFMLRKPNSQELDVYEYQRHTFGARYLPACANFVLQQTAKEDIDYNPNSLEIIQRTFYMDDMIASFSDTITAFITAKDVKDTLKKGKFNLTKWCSNSREFCQQMQEDLCKPVEELFSKGFHQRVLGVYWSLDEDKLLFKAKDRKHLNRKTWTQRKFLCFVSSFYDPLRIISPFLIRAKILLRELWRDGRKWDKAISGDNGKAIKDWVEETELLGTVGVNRLVGGTGLGDTMELDVFCDASLEATAEVAYIKTTKEQQFVFLREKQSGTLTSNNISQTRTASSTLCSKIEENNEDEMDFKFDKIFLWSDSTTNLSWRKNFKLKHKMYIGNRIAEIRDLTTTNLWNYVNTKDNPADQGTRGLKVIEMKEKSLWLQGPQFLLSSNNNCTTDEQQHENDFLNSAEQKTQVTRRQPIDKDLIDARRFSQWLKLRAVIIKKKNLRNETRTRDQQIIDAENFIFRLSLQQPFDEDINQLTHNETTQKRSRLIPLTPSTDEDGIIRSNSRLVNAPVSTATKKPIILDGRNKIIRLLLELQHNINGHVGVEQQTRSIQLNYWVLQCKTVMKKISNKCYECRRQRQLNSQPQMSDLPSYRFPVKSVALKETGVDFCGPFKIHSQINTAMNIYCCLFTCLTIRAVHIEVTRNLQKESCIMAFQRFFSQRWLPERIHSDNALNFSSTAKTFQESSFTTTEIQEYAESKKIAWKLIPLGATHFGGTWERLIGMSKRLFFNIAGSRKLQEDSFSTLICQLEALLNSRPLTSVSSEIRDVESLTGLPADTTISTSDRETGKLWNNVNGIMNEFWTRLLKEYLPTLRQRRIWHSTVDGIEVGDMVWILENNTPRGIWPVGRVQKVNKGRDNVVRSCLVKTSKGDFVKPAIKLSLINAKST